MKDVKLTRGTPTALATSYMYKWSLQSILSLSNRNMNLCRTVRVWNVTVQSKFLSFLDINTAPSICWYIPCMKRVLHNVFISTVGQKKVYKKINKIISSEEIFSRCPTTIAGKSKRPTLFLTPLFISLTKMHRLIA